MQNKFKLKCLVLNADYMPIGVIGIEKSMGLIYVKRAAIELDFYSDHKIRDASGKQYEIPAVILLKKMIKKNYRAVPFNRKNVLLRDRMTCQYCGQMFQPEDLTYDHVIPRSKWKENSTPTFWENIVACCLPCNSKKANKTPQEAGMTLLNKPRKPKYGEIALGLSPWQEVPKEWLPYITSVYKNFKLETKPHEKTKAKT